MAINTLITIRDAIQAFVDGHKQLERVEFGADDKRAPKITESDLFPMLYVAPLDVEVGRAHNTHRLRIYVYERLNDASQDEWENANDTSLMLRDIRVWWNDYGVDDILIEEDPTGTFKTDGELDKVVGYFAEFRFQIPSHGRCDVPINVTPQPPVSGCLPANYVVEYADGTPIQSGEIPSGQSETIVVPNCEPCEPCENATYILTVGGNAVDSGEIGSGQTEEIPIDAFIPACEDATVQINGEQVATVASGGMVNIAVENESGTPLGTFDEETGVWVVPNCEDATAVLRDTDNNILSTTPIASGATENITAPDGTVTVNRDGVFFADVDVTSGGVASVNVPSVVNENRGARLIVSGQTTSFNSHDDGDKKRGRLVNFITLNQNNPFGNNRRFTGITGGSHDGTNWVDVNGATVANRLAAFPDFIFLDWSTDSGADVLAYCFQDYLGVDLNKTFAELCNDGNAFSIGAFTSGWSGVSWVEARNLMNHGVTTALNYFPFNIGSVTFNTTTTNPQTTANCFVLVANFSALSGGKTTARKVIYTRLITYTELGL